VPRIAPQPLPPRVGDRESNTAFAMPAEGYRISAIASRVNAPAVTCAMLSSAAVKDGMGNP